MTHGLFLAIGLCAATTLPSPQSAGGGIVEVPEDPEPAPTPDPGPAPELDPSVEEFLAEVPEMAPEEYDEVLAEQEVDLVCVNAEIIE
jgi:hypothetical protein